MSDSSYNPPPQFTIAEYGNSTTGDACKMCANPITTAYYRAKGLMVCEACANQVKRTQPRDSHAAFTKAVLFGLFGFAAGLALYAGFTIATGIQIGLMSLAVGWIVGKAMMLGSGNIGGKRYQVAAVVLTYAAVSTAAIPIALYYNAKNHTRARQTQTTQTSSNPSSSEASADQTNAPETNPNASQSAIQKPKMGFGEAVVRLALLGLASPFLELGEGSGGVIGLIILLVGMRFAWRMAAGQPQMTVEGPYQVAKAAGA